MLAASALRPAQLTAQAVAADTAARRVAADSTMPAPGSRLLTPRGAALAAGALGLAAVGTMPFDARLADALRSPALQRSRVAGGVADAARVAGQPGVVIAAAVLYGTGRLGGHPRLTAIGLHAGEAIVLSGGVTGLIKVVAGRQRPFVNEDEPWHFALGQGRRTARTSFPSGHTTAAFAFAGAVSADLRRWYPGAGRVATPLLYAGATTVGLSRMYDDRHWASDVLLGAGIGAIVGTQVVAYARAHPHNRVERLLGAVTAIPADGGRVLLLVYDAPWPRRRVDHLD